LLIAIFLPLTASSQLINNPDISALQQQLKQCKTDTSRIPILLNIANSYVLRPGELTSDLDSAFYFANLAEKLNKPNTDPKFEGLYLSVCSKIYHEKKDAVSAKSYGEKAVAVFEKDKQYEYAGDVEFNMSYFYDTWDSVTRQTAVALCERALTFYWLAGASQKRADDYERLGELYIFNNEDKRARDTLDVALHMDEIAPLKNMNGIYRVLSSLESNAGNNEIAAKYALRSLRVEEQMWPGSNDLITAYNQTGRLFYVMEDYTQAEIYFKKAFNLAIKNNHFNDIRLLIGNIVFADIYKKDYADALKFVSLAEQRKDFPSNPHDKYQAIILRCSIYYGMDNYKAISPYLNKLIAIGKEDPHIAAIAINQILIKYFVSTKNTAEAQKYLNAQKAIQGDRYLTKKDLLFYQFLIDTAAHKYSEALTHYIRYWAINDSLLNVKEQGKISRLQIEYQTEEKNQQLVLSQKNIELLSRQDQINKVIRNVIIAGAIALIILLSLLYSRYRMRTRTNLALQAQQAEITRKNAALETLVSEKEWLLKEVHHRVKNNLQVVISLLRMQTSYLDDTEAIRAIRESRHRLQAIALLHQKLYQSDQVEVVDMESYVKDLISYLKDSFGLSNVRFDLHVESLKLPISNAVPMGLVINEAVTNAVKYGFPDKRSGLVKIILHLTSSGTLSLSISDNGIGMDVEQLETGLKSMGIRLIQMLAGQMNGHLEITSGNGVTVSITDIPFADDPFAVLPRA